MKLGWSSEAGRTVWVAVLIVAAFSAFLHLWFSWCYFPTLNWNEMRLAPAFSLRFGGDVYASSGAGSLSTWIYGPVGILVNLPVTFAASPAGALQVGGVINIALVVAAVISLCWTLTLPTEAAVPQKFAALIFTILAIPFPPLALASSDNCAIAFAAFSLISLTARQPHFFTTALFCSLAIWTKQTFVVLAVIHFFWTWRGGDRRQFWRYAGFLAAINALFLTAAIARFGFPQLYLNLIAIPANLPFGRIAEKLAFQWDFLLLYAAVPIAIAWGTVARNRGERTLTRLLALTALIFTPFDLLAFVKIGGSTNALHAWVFVLPIVAVYVARECQKTAQHPFLTRVAIAAIFTLALFPEFTGRSPVPVTAHLDAAVSLAVANRGQLWFPDNPLVTFYSDRLIYHTEDGIATRDFAGIGLGREHFKAGLPRDLIAVIYPAGESHPFALKLLPEFSQRVIAGEWAVYVKGEKIAVAAAR